MKNLTNLIKTSKQEYLDEDNKLYLSEQDAFVDFLEIEKLPLKRRKKLKFKKNERKKKVVLIKLALLGEFDIMAYSYNCSFYNEINTKRIKQ